MLSLDGKRAFVAGVGSGIGGACVTTLKEAGARVACFDIDADIGRAVAPDGLAFQGDARKQADVNAAVSGAHEALGGLDIVVDVIGEARWGRTVELSDDDWDQSFDIVLRHFFYLARATAPRLAAGASITAIASVSGLRSAPLHGPYGAAKAGLMALVRTLAMELAAQDVRVNAVAPGAVRTPRVADRLTEPSRDVIPLGRYAEPVDIAHAVAFLASDLASYITGQTLIVDGGATAQFPLSLRA